MTRYSVQPRYRIFVKGDSFLCKSIGKVSFCWTGNRCRARQADRKNKKVIFKSSELFTDFITEINNTQVDNAQDLAIVMSVYILKEYSKNDSGTARSLS